MPSQWRRVIRGLWGSKTSKPIRLKFGVRPYMQNMVAAAAVGGLWSWVKLYLREFIFLDSFNAWTAKPEKRGFLLSAHVSVVGVHLSRHYWLTG